MLAFELLREHKTEPSAVQTKLADVEETPRAQPVRPIADPFDETGEDSREHVGSIDIVLLDRRQIGAELAELGLDDRANERVELIDDRQGRIEADRADLDDFHVVAWARRIPTRRLKVHHDQIHNVDPILGDRRGAVDARRRFVSPDREPQHGRSTERVCTPRRYAHDDRGSTPNLAWLSDWLAQTPMGPLDKRHGSADRELMALIAPA